MDNAMRFLDAFACIEKECRIITKEIRYTKFYILLQEAAKLNSIVRKYEMELNEFADLRNAIVHQRTDKGEVIAQPVDWVVAEIEKIASLLSQPVTLKDCITKAVKTCHPDNLVVDIYKKMEELATSKLPIYEDSQFFGLLTLEMVAHWAVLEKEKKPDATVRDIYRPQYKTEKVLFVSQDTPVAEVIEIFEDGMNRGVRILAILITAKGTKDEKALGILTQADLPLLLDALDK